MNVHLREYVNKRKSELTEYKSELLESLKEVNGSVAELTFEEEKEILEKKMKFYTVSGALAELEEIKKMLDFE